MKRLRRCQSVLAYGAIALLTCAWNWGTTDPAPPAVGGALACDQCQVLAQEVRQFSDDAARMDWLLTRQQEELAQLDPKETSIRMKMATAMFVLAAKMETAQNRAKLRRGQWEQTCSACPGSGVKKSKRGR